VKQKPISKSDAIKLVRRWGMIVVQHKSCELGSFAPTTEI